MKLNKIVILVGIIAVASLSTSEVRSLRASAKTPTLEQLAQQHKSRQAIPSLIERKLFFRQSRNIWRTNFS